MKKSKILTISLLSAVSAIPIISAVALSSCKDTKEDNVKPEGNNPGQSNPEQSKPEQNNPGQSNPEENGIIKDKNFIYSDLNKTKIIDLTKEAKNSKELIIPKHVKTFANNVFQNLVNTNITSINLKQCDEMFELPEQAFKGSSNITELLLPPNLKSINKDQINDLKNITRINWPANISADEMIEATWELPIFIPVTNLNPGEWLIVTGAKTKNKNNEWFGPSVKPNGSKIYLVPKEYTCIAKGWEWETFFGHSNYLYFQDDSKMTTIKNDSFKDIASLKRIILPSSLTDLESGNFWNCWNLESLESEDNFKNLKYIPGWFICNTPDLKYLNMSQSNLTRLSNRTLYMLDKIEYLILPETLKTMWVGDGDNLLILLHQI